MENEHYSIGAEVMLPHSVQMLLSISVIYGLVAMTTPEETSKLTIPYNLTTSQLF